MHGTFFPAERCKPIGKRLHNAERAATGAVAHETPARMVEPEVDGMSVSMIASSEIALAAKPTVAEDGAIVGTRDGRTRMGR
jgi:hypothetical protein